MILYNVTVSIDPEQELEWTTWMQKTHIPAVMQTGLFQKWKMFKVQFESEDEVTYALQYFLSSMKDLQKYQSTHALRLQQDHLLQFPSHVAFRTVLEEIVPE